MKWMWPTCIHHSVGVGAYLFQNGLVRLLWQDLLQLLSGRRLPSTAQPFAHAYGGHQQLGLAQNSQPK